MADLPVLTVSQLVGAVKRALAGEFGSVRVRGEISNYKKAASGHAYFVLKDRDAQVRAVLFRGAAIGVRFQPGDGMEVEAEGEFTVYEPRGDLQLVVRRLLPSGAGALMQAFLRLKARLEAEGLFDPARKRALPAHPQCIALVTSPTGAVVRDMIHVLSRRWPIARIVLVPVRVQGEGAADEIAAALGRVGRWGGADVVIVGRGGGSLEDLWAFNEEAVARAIAACPIPVVSAVGHETDFTISDFAADVRAPTPTAAAVAASPDIRDLARGFRIAAERMAGLMERRIRADRATVESIAAAYGLRRPEQFLHREAQRVDGLRIRLDRGIVRTLERARRVTELSVHTLAAHRPERRLKEGARAVSALRARLGAAANGKLKEARNQAEALRRTLAGLGPSGVLERGYCIARSGASGPLITRVEDLAPGSSLTVQFHRGRAAAQVTGIEAGGLVEWEEGGRL